MAQWRRPSTNMHADEKMIVLWHTQTQKQRQRLTVLQRCLGFSLFSTAEVWEVSLLECHASERQDYATYD